MSLRWRIMGAMVAVIILAILVNIGVAYFATQARLGAFVDEIGDDEARQLAQNLSREYTASGGWETVDRPLTEAGISYQGVQQQERSQERGGEHLESSGHDQIRIVVADVDGRVVKDTSSELSPGTLAPNLDGRREAVLDLATDEIVGYVNVDVDREFLSTESHGFLTTLLAITLVGGTLTAGAAILLAAWWSKRITAPVRALTEATQGIAHGEAAQLPVTSSDELGRMSAAFNRMATALESQRELRRRLINDVSHELNTPLSVIQLEAKGLRDGLQSPRRASDHITQEVERLRGLATDLSWLAETDYGELRLALEECSIHALLAAEVERWQPQSQARQVELSLHLTGGLPDLNLDHMRMSQALGNVLNNALQATDAGGSIVVGAALDGGESLVVSITDDGIGIDAADLPHVFDRFYRTDQARSRGAGGTGLGLAIARAIVEAHGGEIALASEGPGHGVTATIRLPLNT
ncbi:MAG: HAMP domain-containing sensor histidine kinase [Chloroflexi bacterium]|nr:HAMP domain-containing sensor histidine kinase [Chloroflexota bacterium]